MSDTSCEAVFRGEREVINEQRMNRGAIERPKAGAAKRAERTGYVGLALSGGGIRSASFAIGVMQGLYGADMLKYVDYLSTVSGGGYAGTAYTWSNHLGRGNPAFPFGTKGVGARSTTATNASDDVPRDALAYIRQHGNYLTPNAGLSVLTLAGVVLRNIIVCFSVYTAGLIALALALHLLWPGLRSDLHAVVTPTNPQWDYLLPAALFAAIFVAIALLYSFITWLVPKVRPKGNELYSGRVWFQMFGGTLLSLILLLVIVGSVPIVVDALDQWARTFLVSSTSGVGLAGVIYEFLTQHRKGVPKFPRLTATRVAITAAALLYGWLLIAYVAASAIACECAANGGSVVAWLIGVVAYFLFFGLFINTNIFGVGRMYRDRLMEAFMPDKEAMDTNRWMHARKADNTFLPDVCTKEDPGPYHLINTNVILTQAESSKYRNRAGDNFVMSHLYSGSDATGWYRTKDCLAQMSLATAMAISGAAVNPNTGGGGEGLTRNRYVAFMLALFNVRLGYWIRNPRLAVKNPGVVLKLWPNLLHPGLRQGLFGTGQNENAAFIELTDGGHFDNTGIYELIRRRVDTIILSLASADPDYSLEDLAIAVERVRTDFGVFIDFPKDSFKNLAPDSGGEPGATPVTGLAAPKGYSLAALHLSKQGFAVADISYPNEQSGKLIVIKSSTVLDIPIDTIVYKLKHGEFPNESTADQFFSERQFEAYRELGYRITKETLKEYVVQVAIDRPGEKKKES